MTIRQGCIAVSPAGSWALILFGVLLSACSVVADADGANGLLSAWTQLLALASVVQLAYLLKASFSFGWLALFAYLFHFLFVGGSCAAAALLEFWPDVLQRHWLVLLAGIQAQLALGCLVLSSRPLTHTATFRSDALLVITFVCCSAAIVKFAYYGSEILQAGGHLAIYAGGDAIRDASPWFIRLLATGAPAVAVVALSSAKLPLWVKALAILAVAVEFAIGTRSRPVFLFAATLALVQKDILRDTTSRAYAACLLVVAVVVLIWVGYVRESYTIGAVAYLLVTLEAISGTVQAAVAGVDLQNLMWLTLTQFTALLLPTDLSTIDTVAKAVSLEAIPDAYAIGYGLSSSALLESSALLTPYGAVFCYPLIAALLVYGVSAAIASRTTLLYLAGVAMLPALFYVWRAELWQPAVLLVKALPFYILLSLVRRPIVRPANEAYVRQA